MLDISVYSAGLVSFLFLVFASWCIGEGGEILGKKYDASVIGGLVIAWLNTAPEAIFFIIALESDNPRFAVGAVSGSSIVVCTVALGFCLWVGAEARKKPIVLQPAVKKQCKILGASLIITTSIAVFGFSLILGLLGVFFYFGFMYYSLATPTEEKPEKKHDEEMGKVESDEEEEEEDKEEEASTLKGALYLFTGGIMIIIFSPLFINAVVEVASLMKVNPTLLAFFLAPVASEAPEIMESISLSRKGCSQNINIAFSNLIGGTITKTTLLCGIFCFYGVHRGFIWETPSYTLSLALLIFAAASASVVGLLPQQTKYHGMFLLFVFVLTGIVEFTTNTHLETEMFPDEGFAHDDAHPLPVP